MFNSLKSLYNTPYNKIHPFKAILHFLEWKFIRLFKLSNYKKKLWNDKYIFLHYDSFQSMWIMYNWIVDWEEFNLIQNFVKKDDYCLDVGANMGFYTIWFSKFCNNVFSFEPNKKNFDRLSANIALNKKLNIYPYQFAVGDFETEVSFTKNLDGQNHISLDKNDQLELVKCKRLDNILKEQNIDSVHYIKIDVEGFELGVLKGLGDYFSNKKISIIQIEINDSISNSSSTINDLINFIGLNGYNLFSYNVTQNCMEKEDFKISRENYFLLHDVTAVNNILEKTI